MSATKPSAFPRSACSPTASVGTGVEKLEHCDGCRRFFPLRGVELIGGQLLCADCAPAEFNAPLHPHLPRHPRLRSERPGPRA